MASIKAGRNPAEHPSVGPEASGDAPSSADAALDLEMTSAVVERGLLMIFGPDGDPLPPGAFAAAAADRPDAGVRIGTDARMPAHRVAAVLDAQSTGRLAAGEDEANAWIEAMLGLGPQPTTCTPSELHAEDGACGIALTGDEIRIGMADAELGGAPPADAQAAADDPVLLGLPETLVLGPDGVLDLGCVADAVAGSHTPVASIVVSGLPDVAMLSAGARDDSGAWHLSADELSGLALFAIPERLTDFPLVFTFRTADGELARSLRIELERATEEGSPEAAGDAVAAGGDPEAPILLSQAQIAAAEPFGRAEAAMVIVAGLPPGAILSSGIDNGDGSWSVPGDGPGEIGVALPAGDMQEHRLVLTAVGIGGRDGGLATMSREIVLVPGQPIRLSALDGAGPDREPAALPLDLHDLVSDLAGAARPDAIVIGGLPDGASLSQGVHDKTIASWILRPGQLAGLTLRHVRAGRCDLKVTVLAIDRATGRPHAGTRGLDLDLGNPPGQVSSCRPAGGVGFFRPLGNRRGLM
jgi:hypothetical protein